VTVVPRTVRTRITAITLVVVGAALAIAAVALVVVQERWLTGDAEVEARLRLDDVTAMVQRGQVPATLAGSDDDGTVAQVVALADGRTVARSPLIQGTAPLARLLPDGATGSAVVVQTVAHPPINGVSVARVVARQVGTATGPVVVSAAASLEPALEATHALEGLLAVAVPTLLLLIGVITWLLVGRTLEPVEAIRRQVAEISATELSRRVPEPASADEVGRLARTMNQMLGRLEGAARRQRRFVADASHELHSPLATIRAKLEVGLAHPGKVAWPAVALAWLDEQARLERLVDSLLVLARADAGGPPRSPRVVDLDELVLRELRDLHARGRVRVDAGGVTGGRVAGDLEQLGRVVRNLLDNAERYAASAVRVELGQRNGIVELTVSDDGPGIPPSQRERVFERFVRLDEARTRWSGGAGLGLAIARELVVAHGGTVEVAARPQAAGAVEAGARLVVRLPAAASGSGSGSGSGQPASS
jgi:signal transduction histidine kinase